MPSPSPVREALGKALWVLKKRHDAGTPAWEDYADEAERMGHAALAAASQPTVGELLASGQDRDERLAAADDEIHELREALESINPLQKAYPRGARAAYHEVTEMARAALASVSDSQAGAVAEGDEFENFIGGAQYLPPPRGSLPERPPFLERVRAVARECGYSIGVHGSERRERDLDLIAVPWTDEAAGAGELVDRICEAASLIVRDEPPEGWPPDQPYLNPESRPHGRLAWALMGCPGHEYVDLSVFPVSGSLPEEMQSDVEVSGANAKETAPKVEVRGPLPVELSEEACKRSFEHWYCGEGEKGWDSEDESIREDWRQGIRTAYAIDSGEGLHLSREEAEVAYRTLSDWADSYPTLEVAAPLRALRDRFRRFLAEEGNHG